MRPKGAHKVIRVREIDVAQGRRCQAWYHINKPLCGAPAAYELTIKVQWERVGIMVFDTVSHACEAHVKDVEHKEDYNYVP